MDSGLLACWPDWRRLPAACSAALRRLPTGDGHELAAAHGGRADGDADEFEALGAGFGQLALHRRRLAGREQAVFPAILGEAFAVLLQDNDDLLAPEHRREDGLALVFE